MQNIIKEVIYLNWDDFNKCVNLISNQCHLRNLSGVYGVPRGGSCLSVALSHSLDIPFLLKPKESCLVIDDVYETGKTLRKYQSIPNCIFYVWISKVQPEWWNTIEYTNTNHWLVFPWENRAKVSSDMDRYYSSI